MLYRQTMILHFCGDHLKLL